MASKCTTEKRGKRHMEIIAIYTGAYSASKIFKYNKILAYHYTSLEKQVSKNNT